MTTPRDRALALADEADRLNEEYKRCEEQGSAVAASFWLDQAEAAVSEAEKYAAEPDAHAPWLDEEPQR